MNQARLEEKPVFIDFTGKTREGIPVTFKATDWFVIENGRIRSLHIFFDSFHLSRVVAKGRKA